MIVLRGLSRPPSYFEKRLVDAPAGHFYNVITHGYGAMPDYAAQVPPGDRWAIIAYVRALQYSQSVPFDQLDEAARRRLLEKGGKQE